MTPTDIQRLRALAEKATPGPWKIVRDLHPHYLGTHEEFRIFTAWNHGQMKGPLPVVTMSTGIGEKRGDPPRQMVSMRADDVALLVEMDPATVIALCDLAEKAQPDRVEAGLTEMAEAGCMCPRCVEERAMRALERKAAPPSDASGVRAGLR